VLKKAYFIKRSFSTVTLVFALWTSGEAGGQAVHQQSSGDCSPNIANVNGNVVLQLTCSQINAAQLDAALVHAIRSELAKQRINEGSVKAGSLLVSLEQPGDPAYGALESVAVALTTTDLYDNLDTLIPSAEVKKALDSLVIKLLAYQKPFSIVVTGYWPHACTATGQGGQCAQWVSDRYADQISLRAAQVVKRYMETRGLQANCIYTQGMGVRKTITPEPEDLRSLPLKKVNEWVAVNRRIQITLAPKMQCTA